MRVGTAVECKLDAGPRSAGENVRPGRSGAWEDRSVSEPQPSSATDETSPTLDPAIATRLKRDAAGLVCAVIQQHDTLEVLMVGWMDDEALRRTLTEGRVTFFSRSRHAYWRKGDTSGHVQYVKAVSLDCDGDAVLVQVEQVGAACHTGTRTCFEAGGPLALGGPAAPIEPRA